MCFLSSTHYEASPFTSSNAWFLWLGILGKSQGDCCPSLFTLRTFWCWTGAQSKKSTKICNSLAFYTGSHTCHSCMTANWNYFSNYYYCLRSSHKYSYIYRVHAPRILFLREWGKTKAFSTTETVGNASSFSTFLFLRIQIHTTWSHFYHLTVAFHSAVQWGYTDWRGKGWVRMIDQELPCEAQMKKLEKGEKNICDLVTSLHRAESSHKFI